MKNITVLFQSQNVLRQGIIVFFFGLMVQKREENNIVLEIICFFIRCIIRFRCIKLFEAKKVILLFLYSDILYFVLHALIMNSFFALLRAYMENISKYLSVFRFLYSYCK